MTEKQIALCASNMVLSQKLVEEIDKLSILLEPKYEGVISLKDFYNGIVKSELYLELKINLIEMEAVNL